ncbi:MAG: RNA polymerase sigma factor RpoE, partial [Verrucomicrobia bacterium]|nr:RNA polymerase sigma factor RpoE [Verrucomicrobiota bacterium]
MSAIAEDDAACVRSILAGRPERFRELVERYQERVFAILSRYERDRGRVENMAQDVFVKAWRQLEKFDPLKA